MGTTITPRATPTPHNRKLPVSRGAVVSGGGGASDGASGGSKIPEGIPPSIGKGGVGAFTPYKKKKNKNNTE